MNKYNHLRREYPEYISLDQLYRICGIAKRTAAYLIAHGIIPSIDTGKKTWRYSIAIVDVIKYLNRRNKTGSLVPRGAVSSRRHYSQGPRTSFASVIVPGQEHEISKYFSYIYADYPDIITAADVVEMTGLCKKTVLALLNAGTLMALESTPKYLIPKASLLRFVSTPRYFECKSNSEMFKRIIGGFELWRNAESSQ